MSDEQLKLSSVALLVPELDSSLAGKWTLCSSMATTTQVLNCVYVIMHLISNTDDPGPLWASDNTSHGSDNKHFMVIPMVHKKTGLVK